MSRLVDMDDVLTVILFSKLFDDAKCGEVKEALNKIPTVKPVPIDVMREIRAEIEKMIDAVPTSGSFADTDHGEGKKVAYRYSLFIIDKHLKEIEE